MKKRIISLFFAAIFVLSSLPLSWLLVIDTAASESLGSITECVVNNRGKHITVSGSIKHSVMINNRDSEIALYRFDPWVNVNASIKDAEPLSVTQMSITFQFELPCTTIVQKCSLYAVALLSSDGEVTLISDPRYPNKKTADTSGVGFKGVLTADTASALGACAGSAIVDVYLDKLDKGNKSGYIFNADGQHIYFDRETINGYDKTISSYTASGCDVLLRFLISPSATDLPFCSKGASWASLKGVTVNDRDALNAIYSYTYFLISRYNGSSYGKVKGIILGSGVDMPILYNYAVPVSESYECMYARSLAVIGLAASEAASNSDVLLIVPVGDSLAETGKVYAEDFLSGVAEYLEKYSNLTFTVMCESRHNPYKITDDMFTSEPDPDETETSEDTAVTEEIVEAEATAATEETSSGDETAGEDSGPEQTDAPIYEETAGALVDEPSATDTAIDSEPSPEDDVQPPSETKKPIMNTSADGYYCTDNIDVFQRMHQKLKKSHSSVNDGFGWCWYPGEDTLDGALGVCYAYNYIKLASVGADFYVAGFVDCASDKLSSIARLFKYIDTDSCVEETAYARSVFGISDWSEIVKGYKEELMIFNELYEGELLPNVMDFTGSFVYLDYSSSKSTGGWYEGVYCNNLAPAVEYGIGFLQAELELEDAGASPAEIGYILVSPEPLLLGEALTFEIKCGEADGSLYEVAVYINCGRETIVSKTVVTGGIKCALSADVSNYDDEEAVESVRICVKRVTGSGNCRFNLYRILVNSASSSNEGLSAKYFSLRQNMLSETKNEESNDVTAIAVCALALVSLGVVILLPAYFHDKKTREDTKNKNQTNSDEGN